MPVVPGAPDIGSAEVVAVLALAAPSPSLPSAPRASRRARARSTQNGLPGMSQRRPVLVAGHQRDVHVPVHHSVALRRAGPPGQLRAFDDDRHRTDRLRRAGGRLRRRSRSGVLLVSPTQPARTSSSTSSGAVSGIRTVAGPRFLAASSRPSGGSSSSRKPRSTRLFWSPARSRTSAAATPAIPASTEPARLPAKAGHGGEHRVEDRPQLRPILVLPVDQLFASATGKADRFGRHFASPSDPGLGPPSIDRLAPTPRPLQPLGRDLSMMIFPSYPECGRTRRRRKGNGRTAGRAGGHGGSRRRRLLAVAGGAALALGTGGLLAGCKSKKDDSNSNSGS